jgi:hypothetical protein
MAGESVTWEELPYRGAKGQDRHWATELSILVAYNEVHEDRAPPEREPGQKGRLPKHPITRHRYWERAVVIRSLSKQGRDDKTRQRRLEKIEEQLEKVKDGLNRQRLKTQQQVHAKLDRIFSGAYATYRNCFTIELSGPECEMEPSWTKDEAALERHIAEKDSTS